MTDITAAQLAAAVKIRYGGASSQRLKQLTNCDGSATTIDDTVLEACCTDAMGKFTIIVGSVPQDNIIHISALIPGVIFFIEFHKGRDSNLLQKHEKRFFASLKDIKDRIYVLAQSSSVLEQSDETTNARQDMDRRNTSFTAGRKVARPSEFWSDNN